MNRSIRSQRSPVISKIFHNRFSNMRSDEARRQTDLSPLFAVTDLIHAGSSSKESLFLEPDGPKILDQVTLTLLGTGVSNFCFNWSGPCRSIGQPPERLALDPFVQGRLRYAQPLRHIGRRMASLRHLPDRFDLGFFQVPRAAHDVSCFGLSLRFRSAY